MEGADMSDWRKSTYSENGGANCVEVASGDGVMVRDTTDRDGATLVVSSAAWSKFIKSL
jgi:hypothetical protein